MLIPPSAGPTGTGNFVENTRLFGNTRTDPEKFNLYNGLALLAQSVERIEAKIDKLQKEMENLNKK